MEQICSDLKLQKEELDHPGFIFVVTVVDHHDLHQLRRIEALGVYICEARFRQSCWCTDLCSAKAFLRRRWIVWRLDQTMETLKASEATASLME
ncbi:unnamed protein product [Camellia sinensis]